MKALIIAAGRYPTGCPTLYLSRLSKISRRKESVHQNPPERYRSSSPVIGFEIECRFDGLGQSFRAPRETEIENKNEVSKFVVGVFVRKRSLSAGFSPHLGGRVMHENWPRMSSLGPGNTRTRNRVRVDRKRRETSEPPHTHKQGQKLEKPVSSGAHGLCTYMKSQHDVSVLRIIASAPEAVSTGGARVCAHT